MPPDHPSVVLRASDAEREETVGALREHCRQGRLSVEELEDRAGRAYVASTIAELGALTADLPTTPPLPAPAVEPLGLRAVFGETKRGGRWHVPGRVVARAVCGEVEIDLRDAVLPPGGVDLRVSASLATVRLLVPAGTPVELSGWSFLAERTVRGGVSEGGAADRPAVRLDARAVLAEVKVDVASFTERAPGVLTGRQGTLPPA